MEWRELIIDGYQRVPRELAKILEDLSEEDLDWQPSAVSNSLGWTVWHLARVQDAQIADLAGKGQVYLMEKWYTKFKRSPDGLDTGFGHSPQQVAGFRSPAAEVLLGYVRKTNEASRSYINSVTPADLERVLDEPWYQPRPTVAVRLVSILADAHQHPGEASYIRGLRAALK